MRVLVERAVMRIIFMMVLGCQREIHSDYLDSDDEEVVDQMARDWRDRRMKRVKAEEWEDVVGFLLRHTVGFVDLKLVETEQTM